MISCGTLSKEVPVGWQYLRERFPRQDVTRDAVLFGSSTLPPLQDALTAVSSSFPTESARIADFTRVFR
jgi:hypothetical protein